MGALEGAFVNDAFRLAFAALYRFRLYKPYLSRNPKRRKYLEENVAALNIELTPADLEEISAAAPPGAAAGMRYPEASMQSVNR